MSKRMCRLPGSLSRPVGWPSVPVMRNRTLHFLGFRTTLEVCQNKGYQVSFRLRTHSGTTESCRCGVSHVSALVHHPSHDHLNVRPVWIPSTKK